MHEKKNYRFNYIGFQNLLPPRGLSTFAGLTMFPLLTHATAQRSLQALFAG